MQIQYSHHLANGLSLNRQLSLRSQAESTRWPTLGMPFIKEKAMAPAWYNGVLRRHTYHTKYKYCYADRRHVTPKMDKGSVYFTATFVLKLYINITSIWINLRELIRIIHFLQVIKQISFHTPSFPLPTHREENHRKMSYRTRSSLNIFFRQLLYIICIVKLTTAINYRSFTYSGPCYNVRCR